MKKMKKNQKERLPYLAPWCEVVEAEASQLICSTVSLSPLETTEEDWDNDQDIDGGEIEL